MEYFELVRTAFMVVGFLLAMSRNLETWLTVEMLVSFVMGCAWVFVPQVLLGFQTEGELNGIHLLLGRIFGVAMLCGAVKLYLNYRSRDSYAQVMLLASKVVGFSIVLMVLVHSVYGDALVGKEEKAPPKPKEGEKAPPKSAQGVVFNHEWASIGFTSVIMGLLGNAVWFLKSRHYGGHTSLDSRLNIHLRVDFFITLMLGVMWVAYTPAILGFKMGVTSPDSVQIHFGQSVGAVLIGDAILSAVAPGFLFEDDKRNILLARVAMLVTSMIIGVLTVFYAAVYEERNPLFSVVVDFVWILNAILGYKYAPHETANYRSPAHKFRRSSDKDEN